MSNPKVSTLYGDIEGFTYTTRSGHSANVFLGIPYARPPIGNLRFEKPVKVEEWSGIRTAKKFGPCCYPHHRDAMDSSEAYSEDCLYLNIMAPSKRDASVNGYPVAVYIHGGGFEISSAKPFGYEHICENFVSSNIVFVTFNYRLGFLGFLSTGDRLLPGNLGLWDQREALTFVRDNIASFGGDPKRVTLMGQSAGAASVSALSLSPHSNDLFHQSVSLSGSVFCEFTLSETTVSEGNRLLDVLSCPRTTRKDLLDSLKSKSIDAFLDAVDQIGPTRYAACPMKFHPRVDGDFFPYPLEKLVAEAPAIPNIVGLTQMESATPALIDEVKFLWDISVPKEKQCSFSANDLYEYIQKIIAPEGEFGDRTTQFRKLLREFYVLRDAPEPANSEFYLSRLIDMLSDVQFNIPVYHEVQLKRAAKWPTFFFVQDYLHEGLHNERPIRGAYHCNEYPFMFGFSVNGDFEFDDNDKLYQKALVGMLNEFICTGFASGRSCSSTYWPAVDDTHPSRYLSLTPSPELHSTYKASNVDFWTKVIPEHIGSDVLSRTRLPSALAYAKMIHPSESKHL